MMKIFDKLNWTIFTVISLVSFFSCNNKSGNIEVEFYQDSTIKSIGYVIDNVKHGYFHIYDEKGYLKSEGTYTYGNKNGSWLYYKENQLIRIANFFDGNLKIVKFYENNELKTKWWIKQGEIVQETIYEYKKGELVDSLHYPTAGTFLNKSLY